MLLERINDANYAEFRQSPKGVLVMGESWCFACRDYRVMMPRLAEEFPDINFGYAPLDEGRLVIVKRAYGKLVKVSVPVTVLFREELDLGYFRGGPPFDMAADFFRRILVLERLPRKRGNELEKRFTPISNS